MIIVAEWKKYIIKLFADTMIIKSQDKIDPIEINHLLEYVRRKLQSNISKCKNESFDNNLKKKDVE